VKKPNNNTQKAFALSAIIGALMMSGTNGDVKLSALKVQIDRAMKVFSVKAPIHYYRISDAVKEIISELKEFNNEVTIDEVNVYIEMLCSLIPRSDFKAFLGVSPYRTSIQVRDEKKSRLLVSVIELDKMLNDAFGTNATATGESLGDILSKPLKTKKTKVDKRDKAKPKALKMIKNRAKWNRKRVQ